MPQNWQRRHAVQIAAQLPENLDDAIEVLELAKQLVEGFLRPQPVLDRATGGDVVAFPTASSSSR